MIDRDFLRFISFIPDSYLKMIEQLKVCEVQMEDMRRTMTRMDAYYRDKIQTLNAELEYYKNSHPLTPPVQNQVAVVATPNLVVGTMCPIGPVMNPYHVRLDPSSVCQQGVVVASGDNRTMPQFNGRPITSSSKFYAPRARPYRCLHGSSRSRSASAKACLHVQGNRGVSKCIKPDVASNNNENLIQRRSAEYSAVSSPSASSSSSQELFDDDVRNDEKDGFAQLAASTLQWPTTMKHPDHPSEMTLSGNYGLEDDNVTEMDTNVVQHMNSVYFQSKQLDDINQALINLKDHPDFNPFPSHHLIIAINDDDDGKQNRKSFYLAVTKLLQGYGVHVHYFTFYSELDSLPTVWYQKTLELLKMMPNIKMLQLKISNSGEGKVPTQQEIDDLTNDCKCIRPFPSFEHLVTIDFEYVPYPILESSLKQNGAGIRKLQIIRTGDSKDNFCKNFMSMALDNLTDFSMTFFGIEEVRQLENVAWPLKNLTIRLQFDKYKQGDDKTICDLVEVFKILEKFSDTLTSLKMTLLKVSGLDTKLRLPHLTKLVVYFVEDASLDFIEHLDALEELKVHVQRQELRPFGFANTDRIQLIGYLSRMGKSNIWKLVPSLKCVEVTTNLAGVTRKYFNENPNLSLALAVREN